MSGCFFKAGVGRKEGKTVYVLPLSERPFHKIITAKSEVHSPDIKSNEQNYVLPK